MKRFQKLANFWWIENGEYEALHRMNLLRVPLIRDTLFKNRNELYRDEQKDQNDYKQKLLSQPLLDLNILDIGCGGGILSEV
jgi:2-polyprenyl-3-methyl-5-hydroxy-6-metoxy-1,4-benzoquinol methylase